MKYCEDYGTGLKKSDTLSYQNIPKVYLLVFLLMLLTMLLMMLLRMLLLVHKCQTH